MTKYGEMLIIDAKLVETFLKAESRFSSILLNVFIEHITLEIQYVPIVIFFGFQILHEIVS